MLFLGLTLGTLTGIAILYLIIRAGVAVWEGERPPLAAYELPYGDCPAIPAEMKAVFHSASISDGRQ